MIELVEGLAKVNDHQIAFMTEQGKQPGGLLFVLLHAPNAVLACVNTCFLSELPSARHAVQRTRNIWCKI